MPPVGVGSGAGVVVGGGGGAELVGGAGGGFGAVVFARGGVVEAGLRVAVGTAVVAEPPRPPGAVLVRVAVGVAVRPVAFGAGRLAREAGCGRRVAGTGFAVSFCCAPAEVGAAGVAFAMAAARPPVAITAPAATPLVTNDSRRSARSRWWTGGVAI